MSEYILLNYELMRNRVYSSNSVTIAPMTKFIFTIFEK